nr:sigma factor [bacterium]
MSELEANVETYSRVIWYVVRGNRLLEEDARDLFMEIWEAVIRGWPSFQGNCRPATWIAAVARRRCADFFRRRREASLE